MIGLFITFEGIDGAGKSTHIEPLAQAFRAQSRNVTVTREPGGTPLAERIRELALNEPMDAMTEALLMFAARRDHVQHIIEPALARGEVVLCDRFTDATFAYQGGGRGFEWALLQQLERLALAPHADAASGRGRVLTPDLTLWFDLPPEVAAQRLAGARAPDKFEAQPAAFFSAVRSGYARRLAESPPQRFARIDADQPLEAVWRDVQAALRRTGRLP